MQQQHRQLILRELYYVKENLYPSWDREIEDYSEDDNFSNEIEEQFEKGMYVYARHGLAIRARTMWEFLNWPNRYHDRHNTWKYLNIC